MHVLALVAARLARLEDFPAVVVGIEILVAAALPSLLTKQSPLLHRPADRRVRRRAPDQLAELDLSDEVVGVQLVAPRRVILVLRDDRDHHRRRHRPPRPASERILRRSACTVSPCPAAWRARWSHRSTVENANSTGSPVIGCRYVRAASASSAARSSPRTGGAASKAPMIAWRRFAHRSWRRGVVELVFGVVTFGDDVYASRRYRDTRILCGWLATLTMRSLPGAGASTSARVGAAA